MNWNERLLEMDDLPIILEWYNDEELHDIVDVRTIQTIYNRRTSKVLD